MVKITSAEVTGVVNDAVATANDLPALVAKLNAVDPTLATQITGKAAIYSKTPWGVAACMVLSWLVSHYGFALDADTIALIVGLAGFGGSMIMRWFANAPLTSVLPPTPVPTSTLPAPPPATVINP